MKLHKAIGSLLGVLTIAGSAMFTTNAHATEVIKIGTLAPKSSPWGKVFTVWAKAVQEKSENKIELQFFYNGTQGDEAGMVGKMKSGQLDAAAITAVGLSKIHQPFLAFQMPGLFTSWSKLDAARDALKGDLEKGCADAGFTMLGAGDVGQAHLLSKGFAVTSPEDLKGKKPYMWRDDIIAPITYQVIGGVTPVPLNVPEVLPQLNTGSINVITSPALAAEQLQWASKLDHINEEVAGTAIGAVVISTKRLESLPADLRTIVLDTGKVAASALTQRIRNEDAAAFGRMKGKMTVVKLTPESKNKWEGVFSQVRQRLSQGTFSPDLVKKLEGFSK